MNTRQIYSKFKKNRICPRFLGVFPSNHVPTTSQRGLMIINLDPCNKPGSHWVVLGCGEFFDSYGHPPIRHTIMKYLEETCTKKTWWYNTERLQKYNSRVCGHYCIFYVMMRCKGKSPAKIVQMLKSVTSSDKYVFDFVNKLM